MIIVTQSFSKSSVFKMFFRSRGNEEPAFSNSSDLKSVFEKLRFRDGVVQTAGLNLEIKLRFQIPLAQCGRGLSDSLKLLHGDSRALSVTLVNLRALSVALVNLRALSGTHVHPRIFLSNLNLFQFFQPVTKSFLPFCPHSLRVEKIPSCISRDQKATVVSVVVVWPGLKERFH